MFKSQLRFTSNATPIDAGKKCPKSHEKVHGKCILICMHYSLSWHAKNSLRIVEMVANEAWKVGWSKVLCTTKSIISAFLLV